MGAERTKTMGTIMGMACLLALASPRTEAGQASRAGAANHDDLIMAVVLDDAAQVRRLVEADVDPNLRDDAGSTALLYAISLENAEMVETLIDLGANPNIKGEGGIFRAPLMVAAFLDDAQAAERISRLLIEARADVNARTDFFDMTPLMVASLNGNTGVARLLIEAGADVHAEDVNNMTALDLAGGSNSEDVVDLLQAQ